MSALPARLSHPGREPCNRSRRSRLSSWAYFILVGLGLLSFVLNRRNFSGWRLLVWGSFGLLGAWQTRAVPFFAVVAAPITALNLQDYLSQRMVSAEPGGNQRVWAVLGRLGLLVGSLVLVALAWPGWLQGFENDARHVGWGVRSDPSLQGMAEAIGRWRRSGRLGDRDRAFALHPDIANYCAWFCPEEKSFFVLHQQLPRRVVQEYVALCRALNPALEEGHDRHLSSDPPSAVQALAEKLPRLGHHLSDRR